MALGRIHTRTFPDYLKYCADDISLNEGRADVALYKHNVRVEGDKIGWDD
jgi:hypothetical protein